MVNNSSIIAKDLRHIWHPCTQMRDFEQFPPLLVHGAKGSYLHTDKGTLIDALSSWWCKSLGHGHPAILAAMKQQMDAFEHVIGANTTHTRIAELGEKLAEISGKQHVFFASDGSSAVEIAMKLALHANQIKGKSHCNEFISLSNSYHGETLATLSVSDLGIFKKPYEGYGVTCHFLDDLPYVSGMEDPLWHDAESHWQATLEKLEKIKSRACALIVEPLIQGAGGMLCYSADYLNRLGRFAKENDICLIADEIMTGTGRTGEWLACQHANVEPDLICLSKGLTSGAMPLSCVLIDHEIYQLFYNDPNPGNAFLHSHTHSGNALAVSAALATIEVMHSEDTIHQARHLGQLMQQQFTKVCSETNRLSNFRSLGVMVAADLQPIENRRVGLELAQQALKRGALLRPIGHTLYWLPPLNTDTKTIMQLAEITLNSIYAVYK